MVTVDVRKADNGVYVIELTNWRGDKMPCDYAMSNLEVPVKLHQWRAFFKED